MGRFFPYNLNKSFFWGCSMAITEYGHFCQKILFPFIGCKYYNF